MIVLPFFAYAFPILSIDNFGYSYSLQDFDHIDSPRASTLCTADTQCMTVCEFDHDHDSVYILKTSSKTVFQIMF